MWSLSARCIHLNMSSNLLLHIIELISREWNISLEDQCNLSFGIFFRPKKITIANQDFNLDTVKYTHFDPPNVSFFPLDQPAYKFIMRTILCIMSSGQNNIKYSSKFSNSPNPSLKPSDPPRHSTCGMDDTGKFHMYSANLSFLDNPSR